MCSDEQTACILQSLNSKLTKLLHESSIVNLEAVSLFEGSIGEFDKRFQHIDIATCIEVIAIVHLLAY